MIPNFYNIISILLAFHRTFQFSEKKTKSPFFSWSTLKSQGTAGLSNEFEAFNLSPSTQVNFESNIQHPAQQFLKLPSPSTYAIYSKFYILRCVESGILFTIFQADYYIDFVWSRISKKIMAKLAFQWTGLEIGPWLFAVWKILCGSFLNYFAWHKSIQIHPLEFPILRLWRKLPTIDVYVGGAIGFPLI